MDAFTRKCLVPKGNRGITSEDEIDTPAALFAMRGMRNHVRSDNTPEFVANPLGECLGRAGATTL